MFTDHPDYQGFLAQMRERPDDDVVRLACADWLDERGETDWAEFVRVGCELNQRFRRRAKDGNGIGLRDRNIAPLMDRERKLLAANRDLWHECWLDSYTSDVIWSTRVRYFYPDADEPAYEIGYCRGFVESVTCDAAAWLAHGDAVIVAHPVMRVSLTTRPGPGTFGFDYSGVWADADRSDVVPWEPGEFPPIDPDLPRARYFAGRWPGVEFTLPPEPQMYLRTGGTFENPVWTELEDAPDWPQSMIDALRDEIRAAENGGVSEDDPSPRV